MKRIYIILLFLASISKSSTCTDSMVQFYEDDTLKITKTVTYCDVDIWELKSEKSSIELEIYFESNLINYSERIIKYVHHSVVRKECHIATDTTRTNLRTGLFQFSSSGGGECMRQSFTTNSRSKIFKNKPLFFKSSLVKLIKFIDKKNMALLDVEVCYEYDNQHECERSKIEIDCSKEVLFKTKNGSKLLLRLKRTDNK